MWLIIMQHDNIKWEESPAWARYYAVDSDGERWWYENKPKTVFNDFGILYWHTDGECDYAPGFGLDDQWDLVFTKTKECYTNRVYEDDNYIITNDYKDWFMVWEVIGDHDNYLVVYESCDLYDCTKYVYKNIKLKQ